MPPLKAQNDYMF